MCEGCTKTLCTCGHTWLSLKDSILRCVFHDGEYGFNIRVRRNKGVVRYPVLDLFTSGTDVRAGDYGSFFGNRHNNSKFPRLANAIFDKKKLNAKTKASFKEEMDKACDFCTKGVVRVYIAYKLIRDWLVKFDPTTALKHMSALLTCIEYELKHHRREETDEVVVAHSLMYHWYSLGHFASRKSKRVPEWHVVVPRKKKLALGADGVFCTDEVSLLDFAGSSAGSKRNDSASVYVPAKVEKVVCKLDPATQLELDRTLGLASNDYGDTSELDNDGSVSNINQNDCKDNRK